MAGHGDLELLSYPKYFSLAFVITLYRESVLSVCNKKTFFPESIKACSYYLPRPIFYVIQSKWEIVWTCTEQRRLWLRLVLSKLVSLLGPIFLYLETPSHLISHEIQQNFRLLEKHHVPRYCRYFRCVDNTLIVYTTYINTIFHNLI